jgi:hypothetical protein
MPGTVVTDRAGLFVPVLPVTAPDSIEQKAVPAR